MNKNPKFSIIMPTYNRGYCIWKSVLSVINQTYPFWELLIVDDASLDDTEKVIKEFSDPRIKYYKHKTNKGPAAARNTALKKAKGDLIAYLDSDNSWYHDFLEVMKNAFNENPEKILMYGKKNYRLRIKNEKGEMEKVRDEFSNHKKHFDLKRLWHRKIIIDTNTMCHKREVYDNLGGWDEKLPFWEDYEYTLRVSQKYPEGFMSLNRVLLDYEQELDFSEKLVHIKRWENAERYIYNKFKGEKLLEGQKWYPPDNNHKSTLCVLEFLRKKRRS